MYGGTIASVVDCHSVWTALATWCRATGTELGSDVPPFVTGKLTVSYLRPARIDRPLELRARVVDASERRSTVSCRVLQEGVECAVAEVVTVRIAKP